MKILEEFGFLIFKKKTFFRLRSTRTATWPLVFFCLNKRYVYNTIFLFRLDQRLLVHNFSQRLCCPMKRCHLVRRIISIDPMLEKDKKIVQFFHLQFLKNYSKIIPKFADVSCEMVISMTTLLSYLAKLCNHRDDYSS